MYSIFRVDRSTSESVEPLGTKPKFWFTDNGRRILFKAEQRGTGEDWAEKIACHLCKLLHMPHVHYELAEEYDGAEYVRPGVISENFAPPPMTLVLGNQMLLERDPGYPVGKGRKYKVREHTVNAVVDILAKLSPATMEPIENIPESLFTGLDVFIGYVMLDAWIANQDRHHENWGALSSDSLRLAPTFDHGASLARQITDKEREERLKTEDRNRSLAVFARKARSAFYADPSDAHSLGTFEAFLAFAKLSPPAADFWLNRLASVSRAEVKNLIDEVPEKRMSVTAKKFTLELLEENKRRLLERSQP